MIKQLVTISSSNQKIGPVAATYRPVGETCPECPIEKICYAKRGRAGMVARRSAEKEDDLEKASGVPLIRHLVSGDFFKKDSLGRSIIDRPYVKRLNEWHNEWAQRWTKGWTYTHGAKRLQAAGFGPDHWHKSLTVLASCQSVEEAKDLQAAGWKTARVAADRTDLQDNEAICPYDLEKGTGPHKTNCASCRMCFEEKFAKVNIVFLAS